MPCKRGLKGSLHKPRIGKNARVEILKVFLKMEVPPQANLQRQSVAEAPGKKVV